MNILQVQDQLKGLSQDQLVREMQQPSGSAPQYLVLSELNRRKKMQADMAAQQSKAPQTTVAQDAVAAAGVPQGGITALAANMAPKTDITGNTGASPIPAPMPSEAPVGMADGGVIGMAGGGNIQTVVINGKIYQMAPDGGVYDASGAPVSAEMAAGVSNRLGPVAQTWAPDQPVEGGVDALPAVAPVAGYAPQGVPAMAAGVLESPRMDQWFGPSTRRDQRNPSYTPSASLQAILNGDAVPLLPQDLLTAGITPPATLPVANQSEAMPAAYSRLQDITSSQYGDGAFAEVFPPEIPAANQSEAMPPLPQPEPYNPWEGARIPIRWQQPPTSNQSDAMPPEQKSWLQKFIDSGELPAEAKANTKQEETPVETSPASLETPPGGPTGGTQTSGGAGAGGFGGMSSYEQALTEALGRADKRAEQDKWLALAQAGMEIMNAGARQGTFAGAVGEGGAKGIAAFRSGRDEAENTRLGLLKAIEDSRMARASLAARSAGSGGGELPNLPAALITPLFDKQAAIQAELGRLQPRTEHWYGVSDPDAGVRDALKQELDTVNANIALLYARYGQPMVQDGSGFDFDATQ